MRFDKTALVPAILLAAPAAFAADAPKPAASPPVPLGSPGDWATDLDYPASALKHQAVGTSRFTLDIDVNGLPVGCAITLSSGHSDLDELTCNLLKKRARFRPATDAAGNAVPGKFASAVVWRLPSDPTIQPLPLAGGYALTFDIGADGKVGNCSVAASGAKAAAWSDKKTSEACKQLGHFEPPRAADGKAVAKRVVMTSTVTLSDVP